MAEGYDVYRRRQRRTHTSRSSDKSTYAKRLKKQIIISCVCLTLIYAIKATNSGMGEKINNSIKSALEYKMDTTGVRSGITNVIDGMFKNENKKTNGEIINEKTKESVTDKDI